MLGLLAVLGFTLADPSVVQFPVHKLTPGEKGLTKRDVISSRIENLNKAYGLKFGLGSPPQNLELVLDTGSSDLWVLSPDAEVCQDHNCDPGSVFDPSKSSSFSANDTAFYQQYLDRSTANGTWAQDVMTFGGDSHGENKQTIKNFNFAVANHSSTNHPVAGIGLPSGESPYLLQSIPSPYTNLPMQLKQNGLISHAAYSLFLNAYSEAAGSILFGGIDRNRIDGDIYTFPIVPSESGNLDRLAIKLDAMYLMGSDGSQQKFVDCSVSATLDSGSTISAMPAELLSPLMQAIGAQYTEGIYFIECDALSQNRGGLGLVFGGVEYIINFYDLALRLETNTGTDYCVPGFIVSDLPLFGDNILRSLYVVYDLEKLEIGIGKARTDIHRASQASSLEEISTGIPGTQAPGYSDTIVVSTYRTFPITLAEFSKTKTHTHHFSLFHTESTASQGIDKFSTGIAASHTVGDSISITVGGLASETGIASPYHSVNDNDNHASSSSTSTATTNGKSKNGASKQFASLSISLLSVFATFAFI